MGFCLFVFLRFRGFSASDHENFLTLVCLLTADLVEAHLLAPTFLSVATQVAHCKLSIYMVIAGVANAYSSMGEKTGFREALLEVLKNASQTVSTTDLTMVHQCVFAELVLMQKELPANKELPTKTGGIRSGNL